MAAETTKDRQKIVLANWKAHLSPAQAEKWTAEFVRLYLPTSIHVILAVPDIVLSAVHALTRDLKNVSLAAQDVSPFPPGGYTGATPAAWLEGLAGYVLIGHRERRRYFHETVQDAANKISEAAAAGLRPILCLPGTDIAGHLAPVDSADLERLILAYTPDDAEALEVARNREPVAAAVRQLAEAAGGRPVLYGGGVNADNVADLITIPGLAGVMAAGGSLRPSGFISMLNNADRALAAAS
ncbi:MAG: triose-phosphate isomerase family protein [Desulfobulbaceae bacterium]|jgi:triosephosphate isomerase|nr:triose-phosphate isomerase [Desulfobulbaceae bacterium]MDY0350660.1 triose-phosphate isomerase family protein [Desulfobulbaceae bacterium]